MSVFNTFSLYVIYTYIYMYVYIYIYIHLYIYIYTYIYALYIYMHTYIDVYIYICIYIYIPYTYIYICGNMHGYVYYASDCQIFWIIWLTMYLQSIDYFTLTQTQRNILRFSWKESVTLEWDLITSEFPFFIMLVCWPTTNFWAIVERTGLINQC